ncbi:MAG: aldose 1-epimerase [Anaerolineae bacterium]|jgi:aldose 1-epimerase
MPTFGYTAGQHPVAGWDTITLYAEGELPTTATFTPQVGCNLQSFCVDGREYLVDIDRTGAAPTILGTPVLYPMPNRVRDGVFTFGGRTFTFAPNNGPNYIHGLVRDRRWTCDEPVVSADGIAVTARIAMAPGDDLYALFPFANTLELTYTLRPGELELRFGVRNDDAHHDLPFGLAIHPYFAIIGARRDVHLQVPARRWMEAEQLLPTGRLLPLDQAPADLTAPTSLDQLDVDDVFWGMRPDRPAEIHYRAIGKRLTLLADAPFTHAVVYTPRGRPFFCIENQSCSTDAHNLYARGLQEAAHLTILSPGEALTAAIRLRVTDL